MTSFDLPPPAQRRSYRRFRVDSPATLLFEGGREADIILRDVGARGGGIVSTCPLPLNENLGIVIKISFFGAPVYRAAKVVWSRKVNEHLWTGGIDFGVDNPLDIS